MPATESLSTKFGQPLPPDAEHSDEPSVTVHMKDWDGFQRYLRHSKTVRDGEVKSDYPRNGPRGDVEELLIRLHRDHFRSPHSGRFGLPRPVLCGSKISAECCLAYATSSSRKALKQSDKDSHIKGFRFPLGTLWACWHTSARRLSGFWHDAGVGVSLRIAKHALEYYNHREVVEFSGCEFPNDGNGLPMSSHAFRDVKAWITALLNRAPLRGRGISADHVFLFPTGMAAIFQLQRYLHESSAGNAGSTILFGFAFMATEPLLQEYSSSFKFFTKGDNEDLDHLERFCHDEANAGRRIQALWLEFPSNPNIQVPDLRRIRRIANRYRFYVFIDDTISSFCNVDLFDIADALVTSLTKSFSGYANVMAGSVVLNPKSGAYSHLSGLFAENFVNECYAADIEILAKNCKNYLERSTILNRNAHAVATCLRSYASNASSSVASVSYPSFTHNMDLWNRFKRPNTARNDIFPAFEPGYGYVLSVEFKTMKAAKKFFDALQVHKGPHIGAHLTIALPYVHILYKESRDNSWLEKAGLNERMIRVSVGLEEKEALVRTFQCAVDAADKVAATR